jgi:hypothetical protein
MLIDRVLPDFDAYAAALAVDFVDAIRQSQAPRALLALRAQTERIASVLRRSGSAVKAVGPEALRLADLPERGEWVRLGADPPNEIAFGVIGRFWVGETAWERIDASDFSAFTRPGYATIACNFSFRPYGEARTLVSYEARTRDRCGGATGVLALLAGVLAVRRQGNAGPARSRRTRGCALSDARSCLTNSGASLGNVERNPARPGGGPSRRNAFEGFSSLARVSGATVDTLALEVGMDAPGSSRRWLGGLAGGSVFRS